MDYWMIYDLISRNFEQKWSSFLNSEVIEVAKLFQAYYAATIPATNVLSESTLSHS